MNGWHAGRDAFHVHGTRAGCDRGKKKKKRNMGVKKNKKGPSREIESILGGRSAEREVFLSSSVLFLFLTVSRRKNLPLGKTEYVNKGMSQESLLRVGFTSVPKTSDNCQGSSCATSRDFLLFHVPAFHLMAVESASTERFCFNYTREIVGSCQGFMGGVRLKFIEFLPTV